MDVVKSDKEPAVFNNFMHSVRPQPSCTHASGLMWSIFLGCNRALRSLATVVLPVIVVSLLTMPASAVDRQTLHDHVPAVVAGLTPVDRLPASQHLNLAISIPLRNQQSLTDLLRQLSDPSSPNYRKYLTPAQFAEKFGPSEKDYQAVIDFARAHSLNVTGRHSNRVILDVEGAVSDIEKALNVTMLVYQHPKEARKFYAPDKEPSLDLTVPLAGISGLNNYALPHPRYKARPASVGNAAPNAGGSGPNGTYMGNDFRAAYVPGTALTGSGQTVGLLQFDGYTASDITYYEAKAGLPNVTLTNVLLDGFSGAPTGNGGEVEVSLDIEMVISMAPGVSNIMVYEAGPSGNWHDILNRMATDDLAAQLSCSWYIPGGAADPTADLIFQQMAAQGQSFFSASGDYDAFTGLIPFPGDTPYITEVGGTTLTTGSTGGPWSSETVWNWNNGTGSGGGISTQYSIPTWQQGISMTTNLGSTTMRNVPDVALTADNVYVRADGIDHDEGGTSCASPLWAAFTALVNQQGSANGQPSVGFLNPTLYGIGSGSGYSSTFHDITSGNNFSSSSPAKFPAVAGYDLCTGLGTPNGNALINTLAAFPDTLHLPFSYFAATGPTGGPFTPGTNNYTLINSGSAPIVWTAGNTQSWLVLSATGGTISASGTATVTASITTNANGLSSGSYSDTITFTDQTTGISQTRAVTLDIGAPIISGVSCAMTVIYSFASYSSHGFNPYGNLVQGTDGYFYGTTNGGGINSEGTIYKITSSGSLTTLYSFNSSSGQYPTAGLAMGADGNFYGTTTSYIATMFRITPAGQFTTLYTSGTSGTGPISPYSNLTQAGDGNFYGMSQYGGISNQGTIFKLTSSGSLTVLYSLPAAYGSQNKMPGVIQGDDGNFYGVTPAGGSSNDGTVFKMTPSGSLTSLVIFNNTNGGLPDSALAQGSDGNFYGTTGNGGNYDDGVLFKMTSAGSITMLGTFQGQGGVQTGVSPQIAPLVQASDGNFYGTATAGGTAGDGAIFKITPGGALTTLISFTGASGANPGETPFAGLIQASDGNFYGTTSTSGSNGGGTVYKMTPGYLVGSIGAGFNYQIVSTGSPTSYGASGLPTGLTVNTTTGLISGTPLASGTSKVTVTASNAGGTATSGITIVVLPLAPVLTGSSTATATLGQVFNYQITATNSPTSYSAIGLPAGLNVNISTGLISGTATLTGTSNVLIRATNPGGTGSTTLVLTVAALQAPVITSGTSTTTTKGQPFSYQITATNNPASFGASGLPSGLSVSATNGLISGTAVSVGVTNATITASNAGGTGTSAFAITVLQPAPVITSLLASSGTAESAFAYQITATN